MGTIAVDDPLRDTPGGKAGTAASLRAGVNAAMPNLARVRRMEAIASRAFPATTTHFDGTWAIRLTAGHPAKRLNSVNPLDPLDIANLDERIEAARHRFEAYGRPLIFRLSPLAPRALAEKLDAEGWSRFEESLVMTADLAVMPLDDAVDRLPHQDIARWVSAVLRLEGAGQEHKAGLFEVISRIEPEVGLFLALAEDGTPLSAVRCVHDNDMAGIFDLTTDAGRRRQGHGAAVLASALKWALGRGARTAWLQVVADNRPAFELYRRFGFCEVYRYVYRGAPQ